MADHQDLRQSVTAFVKQLQKKVQRLTDDVTTLDISTYTVDAAQLERVVASATTLAAASALPAMRQGYTHITYRCDLSACTETGRQDEVAAPVRPMHGAAVEMAVAGREMLLAVTREVIARVR